MEIISGCLWIRYKDEEHLMKSISFWRSIQGRRNGSRFNLRLRLCFRGGSAVYEFPAYEYDIRAFAEAVDKYGAKNVKLIFDDGKVWEY